MIAYDLNGQMLPPGGAVMHKVQQFDGEGALPSWLSLTSGAGVFTAPDQGFPGYTITTPATSGSQAKLAGIPFDLSKVTAARISVVVSGGGSATSSAALGFRASDNSAGAALVHINSNPESRIRTYRSGGAFSEKVAILRWTSARRRQLSLLLTVADGGVYLGEDKDQFFNFHKFGTDMRAAVVEPLLSLTTNDATAKSLTVHELTIERWY